MKNFLLTFIPVFVSMDVLGTLPLFLGLTSGLVASKRQRMVKQAVLTAFVLALVIVFSGKAIFQFLGITIADMKIAGGLILLIIAIRDLLNSTDHASKVPADPENMGVVPLGIPLILGPAVLTTLLILVDSFGSVLTIASLTLNLVIVYMVFRYSHLVERVLNRNAAAAVGKVASLFLAAIAVMMMRVGIVESGLFTHNP